MATEPQWRRPWEERPAEQHQSSKSQVDPTSNQTASGESSPLFSAQSPFAAAALPPTVSRRLPPLHASVDASAEATQPPASRRPSLNSNSLEITSPNIAWHHEASASNKRRRVRSAEHDAQPPHAYSSSSHIAPTSQSSQVPPAVPAVLPPEKYGGYGGHATRPATVSESSEAADGRKPLQDVQHSSDGLTNCCAPHCTGKKCCSLRTLVADLTAEFNELDLRLQGAISGGSAQSPRSPPNVEQAGVFATLEWFLERLRWNNAGIRSLAIAKDHAAQDRVQDQQQDGGVAPPPEGDTEATVDTTTADSPGAMKRRRSQSDKERNTPSRRIAPHPQPAPPPPPPPIYSPTPVAGPARQPTGISSGMPEGAWPNPYAAAGEQPPVSHSPHRTISSSGSAFHPSQQSPTHGPQHQSGQHGRFLPSPSSLNFASAPQASFGPPPLTISGPGSSPHQQPQSSPSAHAQHLQDLQHQVSVKTLALQTLQREYDALLAKLERQRTKCMTLEKKFEVSDVEINSLTEERERLQSQVIALENQADELTKGRDDARREMAESGRQYVRIVEMASRLQAQSADERKRWEDERREFVERARALELGMPVGVYGEEEAADDPMEGAESSLAVTTGSESAPTGEQPPSGDAETASRRGQSEAGRATLEGGEAAVEVTSIGSSAGALTSRTAPNPIPALRAEVRRLRTRTQALEGVIRTVKEENQLMQEALQGVTASGQRMQDAMDRVMGT